MLQPESDTIDEIVQVLRSIYGSNVTEPTAFLRYDWLTDPYTLGSYSNIPLGVTEQTFIDLAAPIGRAYFSGEATSSRYNGFVHGAYFAGRDSAEAVMAAMSGSDRMAANFLFLLSVVFLMSIVVY